MSSLLPIPVFEWELFVFRLVEVGLRRFHPGVLKTRGKCYSVYADTGRLGWVDRGPVGAAIGTVSATSAPEAEPFLLP